MTEFVISTARQGGKVALALLGVMDRIHRACLVVSTMPPELPRSFYTLWPAYRHTWWDEGNEVSKLTSEDITRRLIAPPQFAASAREIDDCLPALSLLNGLPRTSLRVVRLRALQEWYGVHVSASDEDFAHWRGGWRAVGKLAGCSHTTARKSHSAAMLYALNRVFEGSTKSGGGVSKSLAMGLDTVPHAATGPR